MFCLPQDRGKLHASMGEAHEGATHQTNGLPVSKAFAMAQPSPTFCRASAVRIKSFHVKRKDFHSRAAFCSESRSVRERTFRTREQRTTMREIKSLIVR